jgi:ATP adenylyltransferase
MEFILGPKERGCVFCNRARRKTDRKDLILHRGKTSFVILNKYPYNPGHLMVVPKRHVSSLAELNLREREEIFSLMAKTEAVMRKSMRPQGFNMGLNLGKAAGAGIDDHLHFHVIPRWFADTNFWPVLAETKSMPQHLLDTYDLLKRFWK